MAESVQIDYLFNVNSAVDNAKRLSGSFQGLQTMSTKAMAAGVAVGNMISSGVSALVGKIGQSMPFVSQIFDQMSNVIFKNLFWPLQQEILPILQSMMGWVRDNRIQIVKLGSVIANVFRGMVMIVKSVFSIIQNVVTGVFDNIFGKGKFTFDRFINLMNMMVLKIVFLFTFLSMLLEPVFQGIGATIGWLYTNVIEPFIKGFADGFLTGIMPAMGEFEALWNEIKTLFSSFVSGDGGKVAELFYTIGKIMGGLIVLNIRVLIRHLTTLLRFFNTVFTDPGKAFKQLGQDLLNTAYEIVKGVMNIFFGINLDAVIARIVQKFTDAKNYLLGIWDGIKEKITGVFDGAIQWVKSKWEEFSNWFMDLPFVKNLKEIYDKTSELASGAKSKVVEFFTGGTPATAPQGNAGGSSTRTTNNTSNVTTTVNVNGGNPAEVQAAIQRATGVDVASQVRQSSMGKGRTP